MENDNLKTIISGYIQEIDKRVENKILEQSNADLLKKLINKAESITEAHSIAALGTTYKRTGFYFDKKLEKYDETIKYFKKNTDLSFKTSADHLTHKLIIGDNYPSLLNLLIEYKNKIDVIYIDPPYGKDSMGEFAETNYNNAITRDNLLSMLYPRLQLAKQLLSNTGVIFCSIDDKNHAYVKCLFDEVFGERNFILNIVRNISDGNNIRQISVTHEYVLVYKKSTLPTLNIDFNPDDRIETRLTNNGNTRQKILFKKGLKAIFQEEKTFTGIIGGKSEPIQIIGEMKFKNGKLLEDVELEAEWRMPDILKKIFNEEEAFDNKGQQYLEPYFTNSGVPYIKKIRNSGIFRSVQTWENNIDELNNIFDQKVFDNPKPVKMIFDLLKIFSSNNSIILDFFAGSGTTGQAVLELNKEDGGNRQFILCTNNEKTDKNPNGIAYDVTSKRLKRVMTGKCYDGTDNFKWLETNKSLGNNLDVYEIKEVANNENTENKTPFDVIDETLYGENKLTNTTDKIMWVVNNFENTQKHLE